MGGVKKRNELFSVKYLVDGGRGLKPLQAVLGLYNIRIDCKTTIVLP
jgi:hypothetical protein